MKEQDQQIKNLRSWIIPKEVQIHILKQNIELQELILKHKEINIKDGWLIKEKEKNILEARTDFERKIAGFELATKESDIKNGFEGQLEKFKLEELKIQLDIEQKGLEGIKRKIKILERNGKIEAETTKDPNTKEPNVDLGFGRK
jgi:hypothetical protein